MAGLKTTDQGMLGLNFLYLFESSPAIILNAARIVLALSLIQTFDSHHNINILYPGIYYIIFLLQP